MANFVQRLFGVKGRGEEVIRSRGTSDTSWSLTPSGKEKAEAMQLRSPYFEVLTNLQEAGGTCTTRELAERTGWPATKVDGVAKSLMSSGYIKRLKI